MHGCVSYQSVIVYILVCLLYRLTSRKEFRLIVSKVAEVISLVVLTDTHYLITCCVGLSGERIGKLTQTIKLHISCRGSLYIFQNIVFVVFY